VELQRQPQKQKRMTADSALSAHKKNEITMVNPARSLTASTPIGTPCDGHVVGAS